MILTPAQKSFLAAHHLVDQLYASGVRSIWISPGFRNSPVIAAAHRYSSKIADLSVNTAVDERGAGFAALGESVATKKPVVVVCTSGTAVANLYPAVLEAFYSSAPLVVVSCDRPQELIGVGANQTMDQWDFFNKARKFFAAISAIDGELTGLQNLRYIAGKAVFKACEGAAGPAHLNLAFREPFAFGEEDIAAIPLELLNLPRSSATKTILTPDRAAKESVRDKIRQADKVLVLASVGAMDSADASMLAKVAETNDWVFVAEGSSRGESSFCDFFAQTSEGHTAILPDLIIRFGAPLISKQLNALIPKAKLGQIIIDPTGELRNPDYGSALFCSGDVSIWLKEFAELENKNRAPTYRKQVRELNASVRNAIYTTLNSNPSFTEWHSTKIIAESLRDGEKLFLGNSMPVRDFIWIGAGFSNAAYEVYSNRGLSGIDGLMATALGVAKSGGITTAIIGDLSAAHDASSLALLAAHKEELNLTMCVINNGGGEIFRFVNTAKYPAEQSKFTTPLEIDFSQLAAAYGLSFSRASSAEELRDLLELKTKKQGVRLIEICVDREASTKLRADFFSKWKK